MEYKQFNLTDGLAQVIASLISINEKEEYVCKIIDCEVLPHQKVIMHAKDKHHEEYKEIRDIAKKTYPYLVIMTKQAYEKFQTIDIFNKKDINLYLYALDAIYMEYFGEFQPILILNKFPYLQDFFEALNTWREETGRATLDDDVLVRAREKSTSEKLN